MSCARSARASRSAHTHEPYCDTCLRLPRAMSLHVDDTFACQCTGCGPVRGLVCAVSARRCECQRQLQRPLPVVHTCVLTDNSHYTGEHVLVRDGIRRNGSSVEMACHHGIVVVEATGVRYPEARHCSIPGRHASSQGDIIALSTNKRWRACRLSIECASDVTSDTFIVRCMMFSTGAHLRPWIRSIVRLRASGAHNRFAQG